MNGQCERGSEQADEYLRVDFLVNSHSYDCALVVGL